VAIRIDSQPSVLVVDDDPMVVDVITEKLREAGYVVQQAASAHEAVELYQRERPDLIVLDLILPDADGLVVCARLRADADVPIVIVSGTRRDRDRVLALELGADDFISKPFDLEELEARVGAVLRRAGRGAAPRGPVYRLDPTREALVCEGESIDLTPIEYSLLGRLLDRPNRVVTRTELAQAAWGRDDLAASRTVDAHLRRLRAKLSHGPSWAPRIVVVHGRGYLLDP